MIQTKHDDLETYYIILKYYIGTYIYFLWLSKKYL